MHSSPSPKGIYFASKAVHGPRWRGLRSSGLPIVSTWIDEAEVGATSDWSDLWKRCISEAASSRAVLVYVEDGETLKGALVEAGAALAFGVPVYVVAPPGFDHSFVRHPLVSRYDNIDDALRMIAKINALPSDLPGLEGLVRDVTSFCEACGNKVSPFPITLTEEHQHHRDGMLSEEWEETRRGIMNGDLVQIADGLADMIYVAIGTALERGIKIALSPFLREATMPGMVGLLERKRLWLGTLGAGRHPMIPGIHDGSRLVDDCERLGQLVSASLSSRAASDGRYLGESLGNVLEALIGLAVSCRIPLDEVWAEVHRSNMEKIDHLSGKVIRSPTGKVVKPEGWVGPDVAGILMRHGWVPEA